MTRSQHIYEVRPRKDHDGVDLISDVLPFGRLWYDTPDNAIGYAMHSSRSHDAVIRVYDAAGNVIEMLKYKADFHRAVSFCYVASRRHRVDKAASRRSVGRHNAGREQTNAKIPVSRILYRARFEGGAPRGGIETPRGSRAINERNGWATGSLLLCLWGRRLHNHCRSAEQRGCSSPFVGRQRQRGRGVPSNSTDHTRGSRPSHEEDGQVPPARKVEVTPPFPARSTDRCGFYPRFTKSAPAKISAALI